jgi:formylglycine-generating enzyme required for sulfatase activity
MKLTVGEHGGIVLSELYCGIVLDSGEGEKIGICQRDGRFEIKTIETKSNSPYIDTGAVSVVDNRFVHIPGGTFLMGSPESEKGHFEDEFQHEVTVQDFSIGKFCVTNKEYNEYLKATGKPLIQKLDDLPATYVSWHDANDYCDWLTATRNDGHTYRLPTEAEWEYACRAGSTGAYCFGDDPENLVDYAWFDRNSGDTVHPVGQKLPNSYGLYDMHGNVWEWCSDTYEGSRRVLRGGAWAGDSRYCRCAYRCVIGPGYRCGNVGFRICQQI